MRNQKISLMGVLVLSLSVVSINVSHASTFDFTEASLGEGAGSAYSSLGMSSGGIDLTVQAYRIPSTGDEQLINEEGNTGLGVYLNSETGHGDSLGVWSGNGLGNMVDGGAQDNYKDEGLLFVFNRVVSLSFINFDYFNLGADTSDDFNITVDGRNLITDYSDRGVTSTYVTNTSQQDHFLFNNLIGKEFLIWADGSSDSFTVSDLKVSAVPLPGAIWLMGSALLGLFSLSGKRKQES